MNGTSFVGLMQNAALLLAVTCIFDVAATRLRTERTSFVQALFGLALGTIGIIVMLTPWTFGQGIVFDTRSILLGIAGLFFGAIPTMIAMTMAAVFRFYQGGAGVLTGVIVVIASGTIGIAWRHFRRRPLAEISWRDLYLFGIVVHLVMLAMMFTLPWDTALRVLASIALPVMVIYPVGTAFIGVLITARLRRELVAEALTKSEEKFRKAFYTSPDSVNINRLEDGMYVSINPGFTRIMGYTEQHIIGKTSVEYNIWDNIGDRQRLVEGLQRNGQVTNLEAAFRTKNGDIRYGLMSATLIDLDGVPHILSITRDITDRKQVEEALKESEKQYRELIDGMTETVWVIDFNGNLVDVNKSTLEVFGYSKEELLSIGLYGIDSSLKNEDIQALAKEMPSDKVQIFETSHKTKDGKIFPVEVYSSLVTYQRKPAILSIARDITDRRRAEEALRESEKQYRLLADNARDVIFILDMNLDYIYISPSVKILRGYEPEEVFQQPASQTVTASSWDLAMRTFSEVMELEKSEQRELVVSRTLELEMVRKDGTTVWTEVQFTLLRDENQLPAGILGVTRNIDDRKRGEEELQRSEDFLNKIIEESPSPMWISDEKGLLIRINPACCHLLNITAEEVMGKYNILNDNIVEEHGFSPLVKSVFEEGETVRFDLEYQTSRLNQLKIQGETPLILDVTMFPIRGPDGKVVNAVIQHIDITDRKRAEERLQETLGRLRKTVETNIQVMVSAVEARDPYTAGHQIQVADLARAIATEMGLPQEKIDGISMAGSIHDIGKLSIPSEILSKPTRLLDIEYSLIKEHPLKGYEILKDVETDWPLAEIVYQHHERMDGSGYPRSLKGEEILIEARIIAVADVVESMASHRPYRPALGINAALAEISKNRDTLYDPEVTDACLKLFKEKGYRFN